MRLSRSHLLSQALYLLGIFVGVQLSSQPTTICDGEGGFLCISLKQQEPRPLSGARLHFAIADNVPEAAVAGIKASIKRWEEALWGYSFLEVKEAVTCPDQERFMANGQSEIFWYDRDFPVNDKYAAATLWYGEMGSPQAEVDIVINHQNVEYDFDLQAGMGPHDFE